MAAWRNPCTAKFVLDTDQHAAHFPHVLRAVSVIGPIRLSVDRKLRTHCNPLLLRRHTRADATHVRHFPLVDWAVLSLQQFADGIERVGDMLWRHADMDFVTGIVSLAFRRHPVHVDKRILTRCSRLVECTPATVGLAPSAQGNIIGRRPVIQGKTRLRIGCHFAFLHTLQFNAGIFSGRRHGRQCVQGQTKFRSDSAHICLPVSRKWANALCFIYTHKSDI